MELAAHLGSVGAIAALSLGAMYFIATLLGRRFDDRFDQVDRRLARLETQNDSIIGAVSDLGQRVTRLEARGS